MNARFQSVLLSIIFCCACARSSAQSAEQSSSRLVDKFQSYNTLQLLNGSSTTTFAINSVNGFKFGRFFTGIGTGFDYYHHTTVPLILEARFDLIRGKNTLQAFGNGGANFAFGTTNRQERTKTGPFKAAPMYGAGLDVLFPAKSNSFILGVAFSNKQVIQMIDNNIWNPYLNRIENIPVREEYSLNRIAIRMGWRF